MNKPPLNLEGIPSLQKARTLLGEDELGLSDKLVACQFMLGYYSRSSNGPSSSRLKDEVLPHFTPLNNIKITPKTKFTAETKKVLDLQTLQRFIPSSKRAGVSTSRELTNRTFINTTNKKPPLNTLNTRSGSFSNNNNNTTKPFSSSSSFNSTTTTTTTTTSSTPSSTPSSSYSSSGYSGSSSSFSSSSTPTSNVNKDKHPPPPSKHTEVPSKRKHSDDEEEQGKDSFTTAKEKYV